MRECTGRGDPSAAAAVESPLARCLARRSCCTILTCTPCSAWLVERVRTSTRVERFVAERVVNTWSNTTPARIVIAQNPSFFYCEDLIQLFKRKFNYNVSRVCKAIRSYFAFEGCFSWQMFPITPTASPWAPPFFYFTCDVRSL